MSILENTLVFSETRRILKEAFFIYLVKLLYSKPLPSNFLIVAFFAEETLHKLFEFLITCKNAKRNIRKKVVCF